MALRKIVLSNNIVMTFISNSQVKITLHNINKEVVV